MLTGGVFTAYPIVRYEEVQTAFDKEEEEEMKNLEKLIACSTTYDEIQERFEVFRVS